MATAKWGNEQVRKLRRLWPTGMPPTGIAKRLGVSADYVCRKAAELHLPPRAEPPPPSAKALYLAAEADKLNITTTELEHRIVDIVLPDRLIGALEIEVKEGELTQ
jgi:hypothetical protein